MWLAVSKGVTVQGGLPMPIATPAHGTAFDIVGKWTDGRGKVNVDAAYEAVKLCAVMSQRRRVAGAAPEAAPQQHAVAVAGGSKL